MKIPRDLSGDGLAGLLAQFGYAVTRQTEAIASDIFLQRLNTTLLSPSPLKIGTLNSILKDVASCLEIDRNQIADKLFAK